VGPAAGMKVLRMRLGGGEGMRFLRPGAAGCGRAHAQSSPAPVGENKRLSTPFSISTVALRAPCLRRSDRKAAKAPLLRASSIAFDRRWAIGLPTCSAKGGGAPLHLGGFEQVAPQDFVEDHTAKAVGQHHRVGCRLRR